MSYVMPNSTIEIFKNIPWDNTYEHTLYFSTVTEQNTFFESIRNSLLYGYRVYNAYSYQRKSRNSIKINVPPDEIIDYNYMRFKNTSHANKWFYAFILDVEYINENTALITYELDVFQTYFWEADWKHSYIERGHVADDYIGGNLEPEPVDFGDYVNLQVETPWDFNNYELIMFVATADKNDVDVRSVTCRVTKYYDIGSIQLIFDIIDNQDFGTTTVAFYDRQITGTITIGQNTYPYVINNNILTIQTTNDIEVPADLMYIGISSYDYGTGYVTNVSFITSNINIDGTSTVVFSNYTPLTNA